MAKMRVKSKLHSIPVYLAPFNSLLARLSDWIAIKVVLGSGGSQLLPRQQANNMNYLIIALCMYPYH